MIRNSYFQDGNAPWMLPIPYPNKPPRAIPKPLAVYQRPIFTGCSRLVYHILVINMNAGSAQASAAPLRARRTASVVKFLHAAWSIKKNPLDSGTIASAFEDWHRTSFPLLTTWRCSRPGISLHKVNNQSTSRQSKEYLPIGRRCIKKLVGKAQAKKPK